MRTSIGSIAIISRDVAGRKEWLSQWNQGWQAYQFIGGHKHDDESFRDCIIREIGEELALRSEKDFRAYEQPIRHLEYRDVSLHTGGLTQYAIALFNVELVGDQAASVIESKPENRWLTEQEILSERCHDGLPVSPTPKRLLAELRYTWEVHVQTK